MIRVLALLLLVAVVSAQEAVSYELVVPERRVYVDGPFRVRMRIRYNPEFFEKSAVQVFHRTFDLALRVEAPWLTELDGTAMRASAEGDVTLVVNGNEGTARRVEADVVEIVRTYLPTRPGKLTLSPPRVRYTWAKEFEDDFVHGRRPVDPQITTVSHRSPKTIVVHALPAEGRPASFGGAVGRFTVAASTAARAVDVDEVFKLALRIEGDGNFELFTPPLLALDGFHVYGLLDDKGAGPRTITYDVAATRAGLDAVPPIAFHYFHDGTYRVARTKPLPLTVRGETAAPPPPPPAPVEEDAPFPWLPVGAVVLTAAAVGLWLLRARPVAHDPSGDRVRAATAALDQPGDVEKKFAEFLAAHLDCPTASVITPDLAERLAAAGVAPDVARDAAALMEKLVGARYGGAAAGDAAAEASAIAARF